MTNDDTVDGSNESGMTMTNDDSVVGSNSFVHHLKQQSKPKGGNKRGDGDECVRQQRMTNDNTVICSDGFVRHLKQQSTNKRGKQEGKW
jgi:hypothetical protein